MSYNRGALKRTEVPQDDKDWEKEEEEEPALYGTDDFRIRVMKVLRCSKKYCHDWTRCPFAHPGEKATRRDPTSGVYTGIACPDMRRDQRCPRGHYCPYAHNVFEYWLHPTRYRTALCRDVDKCTRKICFFAHNMSEIRTNLERPYVSPEQLLNATHAAASDPRVQAKYLAAGEQKSGRNVFSGIEDDEDIGQSLEQIFPLASLNGLSSLTLPAPPSTTQRAETMNAFSSMIRGSPDAVSRPSESGMRQRESASGGMLSSTTFSANPILQNSISEVAGEGPKRSDLGSQNLQQKVDVSKSPEQPLLSSERAFQNQPKPVRVHPSSAGQMHSWGSQQNLLNATAHLSNDKFGKDSGLWSTPRGQLDFNPLYSTASTVSDRNTSIESSSLGGRPLDLRYGQKARRGKPMRRQSNSSIGQGSLSSLTASGIHTGSYPTHSLYTQSSASTFGMGQDPALSSLPGLHSGSLQNEYTLMLQREQQLLQNQQQNFFSGPQQAQALYEQQLRAQLRESLNPNFVPGMDFRRNLPSHASAPETGFDLRFGGLGENQGQLTEPVSQDPASMYSRLNTLYSAPEPEIRNFLGQPDPGLPPAVPSTSYPGSLNASLLQALQSGNFRGVETTQRRRSTESSGSGLPIDIDLAQRLAFSSGSIDQSRPTQ